LSLSPHYLAHPIQTPAQNWIEVEYVPGLRPRGLTLTRIVIGVVPAPNQLFSISQLGGWVIPEVTESENTAVLDGEDVIIKVCVAGEGLSCTALNMSVASDTEMVGAAGEIVRMTSHSRAVEEGAVTSTVPV
jgi:hypothetical protein